MKNTIKIILYRMINNKAYLILPLIITPIVIFCAMYFSSKVVINPTIGVVDDSGKEYEWQDVNVVKLKEKVPLSDLVKNKYDAVVYFDNDKVNVDTVKGQDYKNKIEKLVRGESVDVNEEVRRGVGTNIIGYLSLFVLFVGCELYKYFFDDKKYIAPRVISCGMSYGEYAASHLIAVFIMLFVPISVVTVSLKEILKINTNISDLSLVLILFLLCMLSSTFGLLICSITDNDLTAGMLGEVIIISTSLISGCFVTISGSRIINALSDVLPQKYILNFAMNLENKQGINYISLLVVCIMIIVMIAASFVMNKHKMKLKSCM